MSLGSRGSYGQVIVPIIILLALSQVAIFAVCWLGPWRDPPERHNDGRLPLLGRMLLSLSLTAAALVIWLGHYGHSTYSQWAAFGMIASLVGDLIMARIIPFPNRLIGGMIAFAVAHGLYINAYIGTIQTISALDPHNRWTTGLALGFGFYGVLSIVGWWMLVRNPLKGPVLNIGTLVYAMWIGVMAAHALALGFWLAAAGGLLFMASDFIIGITQIRGLRFKNSNDWVWLTYVAGQMGIIYAGVTGLALPTVLVR